jgi:septum site-determining protein MinD
MSSIIIYRWFFIIWLFTKGYFVYIKGGSVMGEAIVVTSGKGGVGKTTTTANIGTGLAILGKDVVVVDGDTGLRNLDVLMGLENRIVFTLLDVVENKCKLKQALIKDKRFTNLYLLPTAQTRDKEDVSPEQMMDLIYELKKEHDYVLIDCPAGIEHGFENAIIGADRALVVVNPEVTSVRDSDRVIGKLDAKGLENHQLIVNRLNYRMTQSGEMLDVDDILDSLAIELIGVVPDDKNITISTNKGEPIVLNSKAASGQAFRNIARRITGEKVPIMDLSNEQEGIFSSLKKLFGIK